MKNYAKNSDEAKQFILSYYVKDGMINSNLASGELYRIPYSEKNEQAIIEIMERQATFAKIKPLNPFAKVGLFSCPAALLINYFEYVSKGGVFCLPAAIIAAFGCIWFPFELTYHLIRKHDYDKLKFFMDYKDYLNEGYDKSENAKMGVSKKSIDAIENEKVHNKPAFNINAIDSYSLSDLKRIKDNIDRTSYFHFDESVREAEVSENNGLSLKLTPKHSNNN